MVKGHLSVYIGPVSSGKTTQLCHELNQYSSCGFKVLYINSKLDTRADGAMSTHNQGISLSMSIKTVKVLECNKRALSESGINFLDYDIIGIDEASFFPDLTEIKEWVDTNDKIVIVVGLDGSYIRGDFGKVTDLIKHSDKCIKFTGKCVDCLRDGKRTVTDAPFSAKISGSTAILDVGGDDKYICVCRTHWLRRNCVLTEDETFDRTIIDLSKI